MDSHPIQTRNILANMEDLGWEKLWMWNFSFVDRSTPDSFVICWAWLLIIFECRETAWHVALLELCPTTCNLPKTKPGSAYWTQQFSWKPWCWTRLTVLPLKTPAVFLAHWTTRRSDLPIVIDGVLGAETALHETQEIGGKTAMTMAWQRRPIFWGNYTVWVA